MDTDDDIELHDLQTIEAKLCTERPSESQTHEGEAASASGFMIGSASGFMIGSASGFMIGSASGFMIGSASGFMIG